MNLSREFRRIKFRVVDKTLSTTLSCLSWIVKRFHLRESEFLKTLIKRLLKQRINNLLLNYGDKSA